MFGGRHFPKDIILLCVQWYLACPLSYRNSEEMTLERGIHVDQATINRWVLHYSPTLESKYRQKKLATGTSIRMEASGTRRHISNKDMSRAAASISRC